MKKNLALIVLLMGLLGSTGCKKCYYCHNSCKVCQDAHFYILIESDLLSTQYYNLYIDSLEGPGLGWTCRDTAFNKEMQVCAPSGNQINDINYKVSQDEAAGWTCQPVQN
jgi:hypothetical protein